MNTTRPASQSIESGHPTREAVMSVDNIIRARDIRPGIHAEVLTVYFVDDDGDISQDWPINPDVPMPEVVHDYVGGFVSRVTPINQNPTAAAVRATAGVEIEFDCGMAGKFITRVGNNTPARGY